MIVYTKLLRLLEEKGYTTYKIRKTGLLGQETLRNLRNGIKGIDYITVNKLCKALDCQPGDLMEYVPD